MVDPASWVRLFYSVTPPELVAVPPGSVCVAYTVASGVDYSTFLSFWGAVVAYSYVSAAACPSFLAQTLASTPGFRDFAIICGTSGCNNALQQPPPAALGASAQCPLSSSATSCGVGASYPTNSLASLMASAVSSKGAPALEPQSGPTVCITYNLSCAAVVAASAGNLYFRNFNVPRGVTASTCPAGASVLVFDSIPLASCVFTLRDYASLPRTYSAVSMCASSDCNLPDGGGARFSRQPPRRRCATHSSNQEQALSQHFRAFC